MEKRLRFVNQLTKEEINTFLNGIGFELNEELEDIKTGESINSYDVLDKYIVCRCVATPNNKIRKTANYIENSLLRRYGLGLKTSNDEILFISDYTCYTMLDMAEESKFYSQQLRKFLSNRFNTVYDVANRNHLRALVVSMGYKSIEDYIEKTKEANNNDVEMEKQD